MGIGSNYGSDIRLCLDHFEPSEQDIRARGDLLDQLTRILREHFGPGFDVEYVGIGRYASDITQAPVEVAIVDTQSELGAVGRDYVRDLPDIYCPSAVAKTLAREGFRGRINSHSLSRTIQTTLPATKGYVRPTQTAVNENVEWLRFNHRRRGLIYPERLRIEHPIAFDLILPGPTIIPLMCMLEEYSKLVPAFRDLVSISYLWCHSLGMREISPVCVALLFLSFLQETAGVPGIVFPTSSIHDYATKEYHLSMTRCKWAVHEVFLGNRQWVDEIVALETEFLIQLPVSTATYGGSDRFRLLRDFMNFLNRTARQPNTPIVSVGTGKKIQRDAEPYLGSTVKSLLDLVGESADSPYASMKPPQLWRIHPLIVQDPFMYTHNHAEFVSVQTVNALARNAQLAVGKMNTGGSLPEMLGVEPVGLEDALQRALVFEDEMDPVKPHVRVERFATVRRVQDFIRGTYGTNYRVELFGSTSYGVDSPTSDLDLVIVDAQRMDGFPPNLNLTSLPAIYNVRNLGWALSRAGFTDVRPVPTATVPIVKFKDYVTGLECDINVNDRLGFINTSLIRHYVSLQPALIPLLQLVKRWAKSVGMNSPSERPVSFSSYTLTLMTIAWFQSLGWLPNLQEGLSAKDATQTDHFWTKGREGQRYRCDTRFKKLENWSVDTGKSPGVLFFEWLTFWGREFDHRESVACIRRGGIIPRKGRGALKNPIPVALALTQTRRQESMDGEREEEDGGEVVLGESFDADWSRDLMCVADPFIVPKNCAGQIKGLIFTQFIRECRNAGDMLQLGISLRSILLREPLNHAAGHPEKAKKGKENKAKKNQDRPKKGQDEQAQEKGPSVQKPEPQSLPGSPHSGVQISGNGADQNGQGGRRGVPSRIRPNSS